MDYQKRHYDAKAQYSAATGVIGLVLGGAFILSSVDIQPLLQTTYYYIAGHSVPQFFALALGISTAFNVAYQLAYVVFIEPIGCLFDVNPPSSASVDLDSIKAGDFIVLIAIYFMYEYSVSVTPGITATPQVLIGGFITIIATLIFNIVPRYVYNHLEPNCFLGLEIVAIGTPLSLLAYIPAIFVIEYYHPIVHILGGLL